VAQPKEVEYWAMTTAEDFSAARLYRASEEGLVSLTDSGTFQDYPVFLERIITSARKIYQQISIFTGG
jgi:hypothetical protein